MLLEADDDDDDDDDDAVGFGAVGAAELFASTEEADEEEDGMADKQWSGFIYFVVDNELRLHGRARVRGSSTSRRLPFSESCFLVPKKTK